MKDSVVIADLFQLICHYLAIFLIPVFEVTLCWEFKPSIHKRQALDKLSAVHFRFVSHSNQVLRLSLFALHSIIHRYFTKYFCCLRMCERTLLNARHKRRAIDMGVWLFEKTFKRQWNLTQTENWMSKKKKKNIPLSRTIFVSTPKMVRTAFNFLFVPCYRYSLSNGPGIYRFV